MKLFKKLFSSLNKESIKYLVVGGIAVNLYGIERATADIDIILMLDERNVLKFSKVIKKLGFKPKLPVSIKDFTDPQKREEWITQKGMIVFSLYDPENPFFLLDVFVDTPFDFDKVYKQRKRIRFENIHIPLVPLRELIKMKQKTDRPQDKADIFYLKKIMKETDNE